jgi:hypothetical protein
VAGGGCAEAGGCSSCHGDARALPARRLQQLDVAGNCIKGVCCGSRGTTVQHTA